MVKFPMGDIIQEGDFHMRLKIFMVVNAIIAVIVGLLLIFIPSTIVRFFGLTPDAGMDLDGQLYGSELILMGLVAWFARDITELKYERRIYAAFTIANLISLVISAVGVATRTFDAVGWIAIAAYLILTVGYGIGWLTRPQEVTQPQQQANQPM
jgi:hypothetical protein